MERFKRPGGFDKGRGEKPFGRGKFVGRFSKPKFGKPSFGGKGRFERGSTEMFPTTCAKCGKETEVPFRPDGSRPIYCRDCFQKDAPSERGSFERRPAPRPFERRDSFTPAKPAAPDARIDVLLRKIEAIETKLDALLKREATAKAIESARAIDKETSVTPATTSARKKVAASAKKTTKKKAAPKKK